MSTVCGRPQAGSLAHVGACEQGRGRLKIRFFVDVINGWPLRTGFESATLWTQGTKPTTEPPHHKHFYIHSCRRTGSWTAFICMFRNIYISQCSDVGCLARRHLQCSLQSALSNHFERPHCCLVLIQNYCDLTPDNICF